MTTTAAGRTFFREADRAIASFVLDTGSVKLTQLTRARRQQVNGDG